LSTFVGERLWLLRSEDASFDPMDFPTLTTELFFEDSSFHAAVDHADGDAFAGSASILQEALGSQDSKEFVEHVTHALGTRTSFCSLTVSVTRYRFYMIPSWQIGLP
jgi:hypothetical protein